MKPSSVSILENKICWGLDLRHYFGMLAEQDLNLCSSQSLSKKFNYRKSKPICLVCRVDYMAHHIQKLFQWSVKGNINVRRQGTKLSLCTTGAMLNDISEPEGSCPAWDILWFIDQCTKCEMSLFLGLILFCHTDKTLNPLQLFPDDQILPMDAHSCSIPQQLCWALESCIFPSINQQSKTPQELCGQECPVRWQADIRHIWTPCTSGSSLCPHVHIWHAGLSSCRTRCQAHASTPLPASSPVPSHHLPAAPAYAQGPPAAAAPAPAPWVPREPFPLLSSTQTPMVCADVPPASRMGDCLQANFKPGWTLLIWNEFTGLDFWQVFLFR